MDLSLFWYRLHDKHSCIMKLKRTERIRESCFTNLNKIYETKGQRSLYLGLKFRAKERYNFALINIWKEWSVMSDFNELRHREKDRAKQRVQTRIPCQTLNDKTTRREKDTVLHESWYDALSESLCSLDKTFNLIKLQIVYGVSVLSGILIRLLEYTPWR